MGKCGEMRQERESRLEDCSIRKFTRRTGDTQSSWGTLICSVDSTEFSLNSIHHWLGAAPRAIPLRDKMGDIGQRHLSAKGHLGGRWERVLRWSRRAPIALLPIVKFYSEGNIVT